MTKSIAVENEIRRIILVTHGETIDKVFGNKWQGFFDDDGNLKCSRAFSTANYCTFEDANLPVSLLDRTEAMKMYDRDPPLTEVGKIGSFEVGYALGAAGITSSKINGVVYCSPMCAAIESAHFICKGLATFAAGNQPVANDDLKLRIENGLIMQLGHDSRLNARNLPKWLTGQEVSDGLGRQVDTAYKMAVTELPTETIDEFYNRMKRTMDKLVPSMPAKKDQTLLIVGHPGTVEGCSRQLYGGAPRRQRDFDNLCRSIPYCASIRVSEKSANIWQMTEPLIPCLTYSANDAYRWEAFGDQNEMRKALKK